VNTGIRIIVHDDTVGLEIGAESTVARRDLGAVAWSVLETLALTTEDVDGQRVATTNARDLALRLNIGKDRAAAALRALRAAGLVAVHLSRDATTSRFAASSYEVRLPVVRTDDTLAADELAPRLEPPRTRTRARDGSTPETLDLFSSTR
jgi:hypothetical protein